MTQSQCVVCHGARLRKESLAVKIATKSIAELSWMSIDELSQFFVKLELGERQKIIARQVLKEIAQRLDFLKNVGLSYLTLSRAAMTLSGGEAQRIRLATQIGSRLTGVIYILDEPSIGLHPRDNTKLLNALIALRDLGNTVVVIEHDMETMLASDFLVDIGPGAGVHGGEVVACGTPADVMKNEGSLTGKYLSGKRHITYPQSRRKGNGRILKIIGAEGNNLKNVTVSLPLGMLVCITGVSGSGKSSLINRTLYPALQRELHNAKTDPLPYKSIDGIEFIDKVIDIDQSPIGRTPRSNPATYTKHLISFVIYTPLFLKVK
jgi:excinuclease ABC subunit A